VAAPIKVSETRTEVRDGKTYTVKTLFPKGQAAKIQKDHAKHR